jgi:hypothetical protein
MWALVSPLNAPASACASPRAKPSCSPGRVVPDTPGSAITSKVTALAFGKGADRAVLSFEPGPVFGLRLGRDADIAEGRLGLFCGLGLEACDTPRFGCWTRARFSGKSLSFVMA